MPPTIRILPSGRKIALVPREQIRNKRHTRTAKIPEGRSLLSLTPTPPTAFDYSTGTGDGLSGTPETVQYPCWCNGPPYPNPVGDCYFETILHDVCNTSGNGGFGFKSDTEATFNPDAVYTRYMQDAGGDNGMDDSEAFAEYEGGTIGPSGPYKIVDTLILNYNDPASFKLMHWAFGGAWWTCSLLDSWLNNDSPGAVWDATGRADPNAGHAMKLTGLMTNGNIPTRTWGISPPIQVTPAGFAAADSEFIAVFSLGHFNAAGYCVFTGMYYTDKCDFWVSMGGLASALPANPFPPQVPSNAFALTASPVSGVVPLVVSLTIANPPAEVSLDFGDGTPAAMTTASTVSHTYATPGSYTAMATSLTKTPQSATASISATAVSPPLPPPPATNKYNLAGSVQIQIPEGLRGNVTTITTPISGPVTLTPVSAASSGDAGGAFTLSGATFTADVPGLVGSTNTVTIGNVSGSGTLDFATPQAAALYECDQPGEAAYPAPRRRRASLGTALPDFFYATTRRKLRSIISQLGYDVSSQSVQDAFALAASNSAIDNAVGANGSVIQELIAALETFFASPQGQALIAALVQALIAMLAGGA